MSIMRTKDRVWGGKEVDEHVAKQKPELKEIVEALRSLVKTAASDFGEQLKWRQPCHIGNHKVCAIAAMGSSVDLFFLGELS